jgi:hypothetical protein
MGPVCARRKETWKELQTRRPGIALMADPAEVLQSDVDVVLVITSPASHATLVRMALEHGKHVVVEKPVASTRCEAQQLVEFAQDRTALDVRTLRAAWPRLSGRYGGALQRRTGKVHSARPVRQQVPIWSLWYHDGSVDHWRKLEFTTSRA